MLPGVGLTCCSSVGNGGCRGPLPLLTRSSCRPVPLCDVRTERLHFVCLLPRSSSDTMAYIHSTIERNEIDGTVLPLLSTRRKGLRCTCMPASGIYSCLSDCQTASYTAPPQLSLERSPELWTACSWSGDDRRAQTSTDWRFGTRSAPPITSSSKMTTGIVRTPPFLLHPQTLPPLDRFRRRRSLHGLGSQPKARTYRSNQRFHRGPC